MAPNITRSTNCLDANFNEEIAEGNEKDVLKHQSINRDHKSAKRNIRVRSDKIERFFGFATDLIWWNIIFIFLLHAAALYCYLTFSYLQNITSLVFVIFTGFPPGFGVTAGVHRLWSHRSYKAKWPLRVVIFICYCMAGQNTVYDWVRDHRVHHKFTETDADPHNSKRGFFFSHVGWLMMRKHPDVITKGRLIDMSDVLEDPVVKFGDKHFRLFKNLFAFILPILIPVYGWNETWTRSIQMVIMRYTFTLNATWSVNSAAHMWGMKPYDKSIMPAENFWVAQVALGEGFHNYHHVFPWDYKAAELNTYFSNITTLFIDLFAKIGWAYDRKVPTPDLVKAVAMRRGDGTHSSCHEEEICDSLSKIQ